MTAGEPTKKTYNRQRNNQIIIRFSDEELAELNEAISKSELSKTDFFLQLLRKSNIIILSDLKEICIELKRQGINLNQALRHYHEIGFIEEIKTAIENCNEFYGVSPTYPTKPTLRKKVIKKEQTNQHKRQTLCDR